MTFNKLGVTLDLDESATGHNVIDLIPDCAVLISDDTARENVHGSVRRLRGASVKDSETSAETREFSNLPADGTIGNFVSDKGVKDECHKN